MSSNHKIAVAMLAGAALGALTVQSLHAQAKPPIYYVAEIDISDVDAYVKEYAPKAQASIKAHGGKFLAASQNVTSIEGAPAKTRVTIQQWESMDKIKAWRSSDEYKEARKIGDKVAKFRSFTVEGLAQ